MKNSILKFAAILAITLGVSACSGEENSPSIVPETGNFTATINGEAFTSNDITYMSNLGTEGIIAKASNDRSFTVAVFPDQFPVGQVVNIAFSPSMGYTAGGKTYIAKSGTMTFSILNPNSHLKGTFSFVGTTGDGADLQIDGQFDVTK